jgi:hypothetical protein
MVQELKSARAKVVRARAILDEFEQTVRPWINSDPHRPVTLVDPITSESVHKLVRVNPMPEGLDDIAADVMNNLRRALDQTGYAAAIAAKKSGNSAHFPFGDTAAEVSNRRVSGANDIPEGYICRDGVVQTIQGWG